MPSSTRREFLRTAGAGAVALSTSSGAHAQAVESELLSQVANQSVSAGFDAATGRLQVGRNRRLVGNAVSRVVGKGDTFSSADARYRRSVETTPIQDRLGVGRQLIATCKDEQKQLDLEIRAAVYDGRDAVLVEVTCKNVSGQDIPVRCIEPLNATREAAGACYWPGASKALINGKMYYDAGRVQDLNYQARSWWNIGLYRGEREPGLVVGYLDNQSAMGRVFAERQAAGALSVWTESRCPDAFVLRPGQALASNRLMLNFAADPFTALESYAQAIGDAHQVRLNPIVNGWCSWFSFFGDITEEEVIKQAEFAAKHLKPYGFDCIQLDDGFYRAFGDWEGNAKFPHGMKWLAGRIRELGLSPGIWLAPYCISPGTEVYEKHPDWLVHNVDGSLMACGPNLKPDSPEAKAARPAICSLDITHPDAAKWLHQLFKTAGEEWGNDFIKIDFVDWTILSAKRYHDPDATHASVYRKGCEIMRQAMGPKRHLLDCGPGPVSVGLIDSMRIELDQPPVTWQQYFLDPSSSAPAAAKRYYYHGRTWINDDDHVVLSNLTEPQAQAAACVVALSGGTMISGDRMTDLDTTRLEILKKVIPSYGQAARPIDLFESDPPSIFALPVKKQFGEWLVLGVFNPTEKAIDKTIPLARLRLDPAKTYVAFDFWKQRTHGEFKETLNVHLEPSSVVLLAIHERPTVPKVVSTDRHFSQGGVELDSVEWDAAAGTIRGASLGPRRSSHSVYIYLPDEHPWGQGHPFFFYDHPGYTLKVMEPHIMRVQVRFEDRDRVPWEVNLKKFFAGGRPA